MVANLLVKHKEQKKCSLIIYSRSGKSHKIGHSGARLLSDLMESRQVCPDDVSAFMEGLQVKTSPH